jgi:hypothetical protein
MARATPDDAWLAIGTGVLFLAWAAFAYRSGWMSAFARVGFVVFGVAAVVGGIALVI